MTKEQIINTLKDPLFSDLSFVCLSGGEVILRPDIEEIILEVSKTLPKTNIVFGTNGLLKISQEICLL